MDPKRCKKNRQTVKVDEEADEKQSLTLTFVHLFMRKADFLAVFLLLLANPTRCPSLAKIEKSSSFTIFVLDVLCKDHQTPLTFVSFKQHSLTECFWEGKKKIISYPKWNTTLKNDAFSVE